MYFFWTIYYFKIQIPKYNHTRDIQVHTNEICNYFKALCFSQRDFNSWVDFNVMVLHVKKLQMLLVHSSLVTWKASKLHGNIYMLFLYRPALPDQLAVCTALSLVLSQQSSSTSPSNSSPSEHANSSKWPPC